MSRRASVDLPQPDSPTMPSVSPLSTTNDTSSTARTLPILRLNRPPRMGKCFLRPVTASIGWILPPRSRGSPGGTSSSFGRGLAEPAALRLSRPPHMRTSMAWRRPSLTRLKESEVMKIATPGSAQT